MRYHIVWSLMVSRMQESGSIDVPLSPEENRRLESADRFWHGQVQSERDPYVCTNNEFHIWAQKRRRRA